MEKVTAGRDALGEFAPQFAAFNDDVLFGEVWSREERLPAKLRSIITVSALLPDGPRRGQPFVWQRKSTVIDGEKRSPRGKFPAGLATRAMNLNR